MRIGTILRWCVVGTFLMAIGTWVAGFALWQFSRAAESLAGMSWMLFGLSLLALPCGICVDRGRHRPLMIAGIAATGMAGVGWAYLIWNARSLGNDAIELAASLNGTITALAGLVAVVAVTHVHRTANPLAITLRRANGVVASLLASSIIIAIWFAENSRYDDEMAKAIGIFAVLTACGTLSTLLVMRMRHLTHEEDKADDVVRLDLSVRCPRCGVRQTIQTGGAACAQCGLDIRIMVP
jgi:hypothetical protein